MAWASRTRAVLRLAACWYRSATSLERDIEHPCPSLCFGGSAQKIRELGQRRLRAECPLCVSLGTTGPGDRALTRQFLEPLFLVVSTRERQRGQSARSL